jgi:hypothetical protein
VQAVARRIRDNDPRHLHTVELNLTPRSQEATLTG